MIPKIIHYCWFGEKPLPKLANKCIASWKKYCPEYEIIRWDETNFDIDSCKYVREAYDNKKWAFVSDYVRLYALVNYGGIYIDTDVEIIKPLDIIEKFEAVSGFQDDQQIPTGIISSCKKHPLFVELLSQYDNRNFVKEDGTLDLTTNVTLITETCLKHGLVQNNTFQTIAGLTLFPKDWFCAKDVYTGEIKITENTYTIHHFAGSWINSKNKLLREIYRFIYKHFGKNVATTLKSMLGEKALAEKGKQI